MATKQQAIQGAFLFLGVMLAMVVAGHLAGWSGVLTVLSVYCIWRAL